MSSRNTGATVARVSPNQPATPMRSTRQPDEVWDPIKAEAEERGLTVTDVVREALQEHTARRERGSLSGRTSRAPM